MKQVFSGIPFVGQKIFQVLPDEDLKRCRLVCKSWKGLIDDPIFWLKKLNANGQPKKVHQEWLDLIEKAKSHGVDKTKFVSSLMTKYFMLQKIRCNSVSWKSKAKLEKFFLSLPPVYIALLPENPNLEVIDVISYFHEDFAKPIVVPKGVCNNWYVFPIHINTSMYNKSLNPLTFALQRKVKEISLDEIKLLASKTKEPMKCTSKNDLIGTPLHFLVRRNDLEMCKFFLEMLPIKDQRKIVTEHYNLFAGSLILRALVSQYVNIFEYLLSKTDNPESAAGVGRTSLLHTLTKHNIINCPKSKGCKYLEMFRILVPKLTQFQEKGSRGYTPLHHAITRLNDDENDECAKEMVKYLAPRTNLEITNLEGLTPVDLANAGARKILMYCKRKIIIERNDTKCKKIKLRK